METKQLKKIEFGNIGDLMKIIRLEYPNSNHQQISKIAEEVYNIDLSVAQIRNWEEPTIEEMEKDYKLIYNKL
jgi:hypothetical protein